MSSLSRIRFATASNDHVGALVAGCEYVSGRVEQYTGRTPRILAELRGLKTIVDSRGYFPHELRDYEGKLRQQLFDFARQTLTSEAYQEFHSCF